MRDTYTYKKGTYILTLILLLCSFVTFGQEEKNGQEHENVNIDAKS